MKNGWQENKNYQRLPSYFINDSFYNPKKLFICINDDVNEESDGEKQDPNDFEPINKPRIENEREALQVLKDFSLFSKFGESMLKLLKESNRSLDKEELSHKKQSVITSFFFKAIDLSSEKNEFSYF